MILKVLPTLDAVSAAMGDGSVQLVFGLDTLDPKWFRSLHGKDGDNVNTYISGPLSTRLVLLNSAKPPLNSLAVRKAIMHAIDKEVRAGGPACPASCWASRLTAQCGCDTGANFVIVQRMPRLFVTL